MSRPYYIVCSSSSVKKKVGWDTTLSHQWLKDGRLQARTESLIVAAQDGIIHTCARVLKIPNLSPKCRVYGRAGPCPVVL